MSAEEFKEEEKKAADIAQQMQDEGKEYDVKDLVKDNLGELKLRARAQAKAAATAILAAEQLASKSGDVTEDSIEEARINALIAGFFMYLSSKYIYAYIYVCIYMHIDIHVYT